MTAIDPMGELLLVGNWKMNLGVREARAYLGELARLFTPSPTGRPDAAIAPPFTTLGALHEEITKIPGLMLAAQNVHWVPAGAHTGEVSPSMLKELGVSLAIIGHSERRQHYGENDSDVARRARNALEHDIRPIVCVGESLTAFELGDSERVVARQLMESLNDLTADDAKSLVIAYEPVWAIGTGRAATPDLIEKVHQRIRLLLIELFGLPGESVPILYGGSTTPENIGAIVRAPGVAGALVGGTSIKAEQFVRLIEEARKARR